MNDAHRLAGLEIVDQTVSELEPLTDELIEFALSGDATRRRHDDSLKQIPAFGYLEKRPLFQMPREEQKSKRSVSILSWNAERLKYDLPSRALIGSVFPDVALLTEVDIGMARSGNRHTLRDLAVPLGYDYVYAVEFAELGLGDDREKEWHKSERNTVGYHGNAIISRHLLHDSFAVRLDDGAYWFIGDQSVDQRRVGFRNAIGARIEINNQSLWCISAHLENRTTPQGRAEQTIRLLQAIDRRCGDAPVIIGGDFNTSALPTDPQELKAIFGDPSALEPLFGILRTAGFTWIDTNQPDPSCRTRPDGTPKGPFTRIDWIFARGLNGFDSATLAAINSDGMAISDHEAIRTSVAL